MNNTNSPTNAPSPGKHDSGFDLLVGQNTINNRVRSAYIQKNLNGEIVEGEITTKGLSFMDWVIPTGGGYFFSPSISSLKSIVGRN